MKSSETAISDIAASASRLRLAVIAAMVGMAVLYLGARLGTQLGPAHLEYRLHGPNVAMARLAGDVTLALLLFALFRLTQMLARLAAGESFSLAVIARFRSFALWLLVTALFGLLAPLLLNLIAPGDRLALVIDYQKVLMVGITLVLFLLARLLERARRLEQEIDEFV